MFTSNYIGTTTLWSFRLIINYNNHHAHTHDKFPFRRTGTSWEALIRCSVSRWETTPRYTRVGAHWRVSTRVYWSFPLNRLCIGSITTVRLVVITHFHTICHIRDCVNVFDQLDVVCICVTHSFGIHWSISHPTHWRAVVVVCYHTKRIYVNVCLGLHIYDGVSQFGFFLFAADAVKENFRGGLFVISPAAALK